jgi:hypothetical protein
MPNPRNVSLLKMPDPGRYFLANRPVGPPFPVKRLQAKIFFASIPEPDGSEGKVRRLEFPNG